MCRLPFLQEAEEDTSSIFDEANHQDSNCLQYKANCPTSILDLDFTGTSDALKFSKDNT